MKQRITGLLVSILIAGMLTAGAAYASESTPPESRMPVIGISMKSSTDAFCKTCKSVLDLAGQALDVKFQYIYCGESVEGILTSVEQLDVIGVDGIVMCGVNEDALSDVIDLCGKKKIYLALALGTVTKEENKDIYKKASKSKYVIGAVHGGENSGAAAAAVTGGEMTGAAGNSSPSVGSTVNANQNPTDPLYAFFMVYNAVMGNYKGFGGNFEDVINTTQLPEREEPVISQAAVPALVTPTPEPLYTPDELREWAGLTMDELKSRAAGG